jgi:hypothetical protein
MNDLTMLSTLLLNGGKPYQPSSIASNAPNRQEEQVTLARFNQDDLPGLAKFASDHHVIVRAFEILCGLVANEQDHGRLRQVMGVIENERARIEHALVVLKKICQKCEAAGLTIIVIKSLDHWPDLGSDLDLYTDADAADICHIMINDCRARPAERSWGDRLAGKWNFLVPGLPELVEFHIGRLGQTGEQVDIARHLIDRAVFTRVGAHCFRIPAPEDRLMISTLQRMYRHFYFRLCDIIDTVHLLEDRDFDFMALRTAAEKAGIWQGTATYLLIVSDYLARYSGKGLALPSFVKASAKFGGDEVVFRNGFLRVPIAPHSVNLFVSELASVAGKMDVRAALRLSLLPGLATAAAVCQKLTGSDKGIW